MAGSKIAGQPRKDYPVKVQSELERMAQWNDPLAIAELERRANPPVPQVDPPSKKKAKK